MRVGMLGAAVVALLLCGGGTAYAAGPSPGVLFGGGGTTWGGLRYVALPAPGGTTLAKIDAANGSVNSSRTLPGRWGIPLVAVDGSTGGVSAGGRTLVLAQPPGARLLPARSRFAIVDPVGMRLRRVITLEGAFFFDAISPDGRTLYLIQHTSAQHVFSYTVRSYDLRTGRLGRRAIVDKSELNERMAGYPLSRATSADGVWAYTLYQKPHGSMFVHALNTRTATAHCVNIPPLSQSEPLTLSLSGARLDVVASGKVLASMDTRTFRVRAGHALPPPAASREAHPTAAAGAGDSQVVVLALTAVGVVVAGAFAAVLVRRRSRTAARSGGAGAGAPSAP